MQRSHRKALSRTLKHVASAANTSYRHLDRAVGHLGRWMGTDHTGFSRALSDMPPMGFKDSCRYIMRSLLAAVAGGLLSALIVFVMVAYGIPALINFLLF